MFHLFPLYTLFHIFQYLHNLLYLQKNKISGATSKNDSKVVKFAQNSNYIEPNKIRLC